MCVRVRACACVCLYLEEVGYGGEQPQRDGAERLLARAGRVDHLASVSVDGEGRLWLCCSDGDMVSGSRKVNGCTVCKWVTLPCLMCGLYIEKGQMV